MSLLVFVVIVIGVVIISTISLMLSTKSSKRNISNKPYLLSLLALGLIILNWVIFLVALYLTDFSVVIRFAPVWFIVSIIGFLAAYKEFKNNRILAVVVTGLVIVNSIGGILLWGLGNM